MMKKLFYLILVFLLLTGCDDRLEYSGTKKIVFEGRIVDENNLPLNNIDVSVYVSKEGSGGESSFIFGAHSDSDEDIITYTTTDSNGYYRMIFPMPRDQDNIALFINREVETSTHYNSNYSNSIITGIKPENITDFDLNFGEQRIFNLDNQTELTVTVNNIPLYYYGYIDIELAGLVNDAIYDYNLPAHFNYDTTGPYDDTSAHYVFKVAKNQDIVFTYNNGIVNGISSYAQTTIHIGNEPVNYIIEY
ncbi:hypothetical protein FMM05_06330 [Flavobacterium zepuense]|uniref:Lipoprotein n=1 Tax=Flavobacterium zepuense TaxID=2593302 RepID=A0A552V5S7_9FLAO|nr:hypothetical protein [Flavobacterium zepuense]TRW25835.1 hypothetical protein FMM05_06330 [Flavobacterium zepuense]